MPNDLLLSGMGAESPGTDLVPVTPSNTVDLAKPGRAIRCKNTGTAGALRLLSWDGVERTTDIAPGEVLTVACRRIFATGTTATGLEVIV